MTTPPSTRPIQVSDASSVGEARRHATAVAEYSGLSGELLGNVSLIATELAVNLHLHGGGGELLVSPLDKGTGVQLLAIDRGRGMGDIERCLTDGYSTAGTAGQGLGAIRRLSSHFDIHSQPRSRQIGGSVVLSQVLAKPEPTTNAVEIGAVSVPIDGETVCGDGWAADTTAHTCGILVADGLGHGHFAAQAANAALTVFRNRSDADLSAFFLRAHAALRPTRGAAAALASLDLIHQTVHFAGIGNVAGRLVAEDRSRSMISHNGTLGLQINRTNETTYPWLAGGVLVMATDGLVTGWSVENYTGLLRRHPAVIAAVLYRDWSRNRDDVTVVVVRIPSLPRSL